MRILIRKVKENVILIDDRMWQFLCGKKYEIDEAKLVLCFFYDNALRDMPCGCYAERKTLNDDRVIKKEMNFSFSIDSTVMCFILIVRRTKIKTQCIKEVVSYSC